MVVRMSRKLDEYQMYFPQLPKSTSATNTHAAVIVSEVPSELSNLLKCTTDLNPSSGHESVCSVRPVNDGWHIKTDKTATEAVSHHLGAFFQRNC